MTLVLQTSVLERQEDCFILCSKLKKNKIKICPVEARGTRGVYARRK